MHSSGNERQPLALLSSGLLCVWWREREHSVFVYEQRRAPASSQPAGLRGDICTARRGRFCYVCLSRSRVPSARGAFCVFMCMYVYERLLCYRAIDIDGAYGHSHACDCREEDDWQRQRRTASVSRCSAGECQKAKVDLRLSCENFRAHPSQWVSVEFARVQFSRKTRYNRILFIIFWRVLYWW